MQRKHLFLKLYQHGFKTDKKPLTEYIKDFDKTKTLKYYCYGDLNDVKERHFRNLDELILEQKCIQATYFSVRYMKFLQSQDRYEDISLQELFELALLTDKDKKPNTDAFKYAYISDARRKEMTIYANYYRLLLWRELEVSDLEFSRRIEDCLYNTVPSNNITLDDGLTFKNPFIDYERSNPVIALGNRLNDDLRTYNNELREIEKELLERLKTPSNVLFDGNRFTILIPNSPMSVMFDINDSNVNYNIGGKVRSYEYVKHEKTKNKRYKNYIISKRSRSRDGVSRNTKVTNYNGGMNIVHPTRMQPAFLEREKSERCGAWWNGRTTYDYNFKDIIDDAINHISGSQETDPKKLLESLNLISFLLMLKNNGAPNNQKPCGRCSACKSKTRNMCQNLEYASEILNDYRAKRAEINKKYDDVIQNQRKLAKTLMESHTKRPIVLFYESVNGYIAAVYKPYSRSGSKKLESKAIFFDKEFNEIGTSSFYSDFVTDQKWRNDMRKDFGKSCDDIKLKQLMISQTFYNLAKSSRILAIDYVSKTIVSQLKQYVSLTVENDGSQMFVPQVYQIELFKTNMLKMLRSNSIYTYVERLKKQINTKGFANVRNYKKAVEIITHGIQLNRVDNDDFEVDIKYGAQNQPSTQREIVVYYWKGKPLNTERYRALDRHVEFADVDYLEIKDIPQVRHELNKYDSEWKKHQRYIEI